MEENIQRMEEKIEEQKATIRQEVVADVLARLQCSGIDIDANIILAALGDNSLGEASFAQQATLQPIRRPSTNSNKEGQLIPGAVIADESSDEDLT
ncbi:uncharacterized protein [Nicotiana sylvestris]|uniref:Uncharacterized protein LOC104212888 isoform X2 n=1 Tax=Nicotiana sylvestris TaxID=4096 RepID=A0A1U7V2F1_NICSY|nr:PREDICTED: uncharacterized protein LOC104212888 isoform X2 [Nicotiana sylvestris]